MSDIANWLGGPDSALASWAGLLLSWIGVALSLVGFSFTGYALWKSSFAAQKALRAVASTAVLDTLSEALGLIDELRGLHLQKQDVNILEIQYLRTAKLLAETTGFVSVVSPEDIIEINSVKIQMQLAHEQCRLNILESKELDSRQLTMNLVEAQLRLTRTLTALRNKIGEYYAR